MRAVIWDWNGTLLDDAWLCIEVLNEMLVEMRLSPISPDRYPEVFGFPVSDYYTEVGFDFSVEPFGSLATEYVARYEARQTECDLQPGAEEILQAVMDGGCIQAILSAYEQNRLQTCLAAKDVARYFQHVVGLSDHYAAGKADNGRELIRLMGMDPADVLLVGDTVHDWEVAMAIGADCLLIPSGHNSRKRLEASGAIVVDSLADVRMLCFPTLPAPKPSPSSLHHIHR